MNAQDDTDLFAWLLGAHEHAGDFLKNLAGAGLRADDDNYRVLRPVLLAMREKYPVYGTEEMRRLRADG